jgi:hypothetical protein
VQTLFTTASWVMALAALQAAAAAVIVLAVAILRAARP